MVFTPVPVHDVEPLPGMRVEEMQAIGNIKGRRIIRHGPRTRPVEADCQQKDQARNASNQNAQLELPTKIGPPGGWPTYSLYQGLSCYPDTALFWLELVQLF